MKTIGEPETKDLILVHIAFSIICIVAFLMPLPAEIGLRLFILVVVYNVLIPLSAYVRKHLNWIPLWGFSFILSVFMVIPDWYLADVLGALVFPPDGFPKIGAVSSYMAGLWAIPIFIILFVGNEMRSRKSEKWGYLAVSLLSLLIFLVAEETMWMLPSWYAVGVTMIGHVAIYIIMPEILLGVSTLMCYLNVRNRSYIWWVFGAFAVMVFYMGNASFFYFLIERIILGA
ncbi:MAG: hypothetical protein EAX95_04370 [Candidatus Thorarchaeota archaeon]|nr:hypothetical protein [Candidatus Thorarchaeota archaeon]